eukprot:TRINITY_DN6176_c0_g1_i3.p1 TRINITY_DN6176_c0_g1~~TRINITY_DN6176_c0_g1_i3.p1  ORF type:complete len:136 (-),score=33.05 TRINITY_DN6176_c0_g1_i3:159-566(-)
MRKDRACAVMLSFFRAASGGSKLRGFQKWKEILQWRAIAGYQERESEHHRSMEHEKFQRAKLKKQALSVQKHNQEIRAKQANLEQRENDAQVAAGKALIRSSVERIEGFFLKAGSFFLDENAKSYAQYKAENPGR